MSNLKMFKALNEQVKFEYYSSYMYLSMSAYFADAGLPGCSRWMRMQADEELLHANKFFDYILSRGGQSHSARHRNSSQYLEKRSRRVSGRP